MTNISGCPQTLEALELDMPGRGRVREAHDEITLPLQALVRLYPGCIRTCFSRSSS